MKAKILDRYTIWGIDDSEEQEGFYPLVEMDKPAVSDIEQVVTSYELIGEEVHEAHFVEVDKIKVAAKIEKLKEEIRQSDYKVLKNLEYKENGLQEVYDAEELHSTRQNLRNQINDLENLLA